jgi:hypothetical protein
MTMQPPPAALVNAVERALAPLQGRFSAETIELMRQEALLQLAAHPYPAALLRALRAEPAMQASDVLGPDVDGNEQGAA